jgi:WD40 repeat protein
MSEKYFLENTIDLGKPITSICKLNNGYIAISVFTNIIIYDLKNYEIKKTLEGHTDRVTSVCELDDKRIVSGAYDRNLRIWNSTTGVCLRVLAGHDSLVLSVCKLDDGRIVSGSADHTLRIWNSITGVCLHVLEGHTYQVPSVCALSDGRIVSGSYDNTLRLWSSTTGVCLGVLEGHTEWVITVCALSDGRIVSGSRESLRIWNSTGVCLRVLEGHTGWIISMCALSDGGFVSGSQDNTLQIWNSITGDRLHKLTGHRVRTVCSLGDMIVSGSGKHTLQVWNLLLKPKFNDHGESLDQEGNVLPNCPICWDVINGNMLTLNQKLPCGQIFHKKCIEKISHCPICD